MMESNDTLPNIKNGVDKMFKLSELLEYDDIVIQCHDNPDADALASAFGLYLFLKSHNKKSRIIYSGFFKITKIDLVRMIEILCIPIEYVEEWLEIELLVTVDCQYGCKNVKRFNAKKIVVIDHHKEDENDYDYGTISSAVGSCSTLMWDLLRQENFNFKQYPDLSTALYYGLYTGTNKLAKIYHALDEEMRDTLVYDDYVIRQLRYSNISLDELVLVGNTISNGINSKEHRYAIFKAGSCDPNVLEFISDIALQVDIIDVCIVYTIRLDGAKFSVRSCTREVVASEFAKFLAQYVGDGGGNVRKAGGTIDASKIEELSMTIEDYIETRTKEYFEYYDVVYAKSHKLDLNSMKAYRKKKISIGYIKSSEVFAENIPLIISTLEGDGEIITSDDMYIMIGILGEVYPIKASKFETSYQVLDDDFITNHDYVSKVRNKTTGATYPLQEYVKACVPKGEVSLYAKQITRNTKVLTEWNREGYVHGVPGDYLAVRISDHKDVYIIREDIFVKTYEIE